MKKRRVLFDVTSQTYFMSMLPAIKEIISHNIPFDVFTPKRTDVPENYQLEYDNLAEYIESKNIPVIRSFPDNMEYDVFYSAYPDYYQELIKVNRVRYHVRYAYTASGVNKPYYCRQSTNNYYDYFLCLSVPNAKVSSGFLQTHVIGNIKLADYKRARVTPEGKKTVLYLPTYGSWGHTSTSVNTESVSKLVELREKYNIVTKMHIGTSWLEEEREQRELLAIFNDAYDPRTPLADILNDADVVLSDLSSAAFDAVAGDVPLALFGLGEPIYFGGKLCLQQQLARDDVIPGTNDVNELESVIEKALSPEYFAKQQKLKKEMFPFEGRACVDAFMRFQDDLFNDRVDPWYIATRRALRENFIKEQRETQEHFNSLYQTIAERNNVIAEKDNVIALKENLIEGYENSHSWKLTKPLRIVSQFLKGLTKRK